MKVENWDSNLFPCCDQRIQSRHRLIGGHWHAPPDVYRAKVDLAEEVEAYKGRLRRMLTRGPR